MEILSGYHANTRGILYAGCMKPVTEAFRKIMYGHWNNYVAIILLRIVARNTRFFPLKSVYLCSLMNQNKS